MKNKALAAAALVFLLSAVSHAASKPSKCSKESYDRKDLKISVPTDEEIAAADRMTSLMAEYGPVKVMVKNQVKIVEDSNSLFMEKAIPAEECVKMVQAASASYGVLLLRAGRINDAFLKSKMTENIKHLIAGNDAYVKYFKGEIKARAEAEKQWQKADACEAEMRKYIEGK